MLALLAAVAVGLAAGAAVRGADVSSNPTAAPRPAPSPEVDTNDEDPGSSPAAPIGPGPWSSVAGVGVGFEHSEAGATAAAVSYVTAAQSWLYLADEDIAAGAEAVITPTARGRLVERLVDDARLLRDRLRDASGTVWYVIAPLATRIDSYSSSLAVVRVWIVRVLAADGVAVPQSGWRTLTFDLEWDGDWGVGDVSEVEGPTPQLEAGLQPWSASYLDETLTGFVRVGAQ